MKQCIEHACMLIYCYNKSMICIIYDQLYDAYTKFLLGIYSIQKHC